jgi:hypothetical protein
MTKSYDAMSPSTMLRRRECAKALTEHGFPITEKTLATKASRGGGPPYQTFNRWAIYQWGNALTWAKAQLSPLVRSTSELMQIREQQKLAVEPEPDDSEQPTLPR